MKRVMNIRGFVLMMALLVIAFLAVHIMLRSSYNEKAAQEAELRATLTQLEEENRNLASQLSVVGTKDYIVSSAMENYSYMNKEDIRFEYSNPEALKAYTEEEIRILMDELVD